MNKASHPSHPRKGRGILGEIKLNDNKVVVRNSFFFLFFIITICGLKNCLISLVKNCVPISFTLSLGYLAQWKINVGKCFSSTDSTFTGSCCWALQFFTVFLTTLLMVEDRNRELKQRKTEWFEKENRAISKPARKFKGWMLKYLTKTCI